MAAGHPRISFELDLFSSLQAHHPEDADYGWRKFGAAGRRTDHVQMWAVGQATAIERSLALFQTRRGTEGIFPEFTFLDRSEEHTSELQSLMRLSYYVLCLKKTNS